MRGNLINHGGCTLNKLRGYTLIEMVAGIGISAIAMMIGATLIVNSYKNYIEIRKEIVRADQIDNAILNIDRLLNGYMIKEIRPNSEGNKIEIDYLMEDGKIAIKGKVINRNGVNLMVETHNRENTKSLLNSMPILRDIKDFDVIKKGKLYYYKIKLKSGEEIINCI